MDALFEALQKFDALRVGGNGNDRVIERDLSDVPPDFTDGIEVNGLSRAVRFGLEKAGIRCFHRHQDEAIRVAVNGSVNLALQAPTATGKSLAFQVPMLNSLVQNKSSHALMIYPTKALGLDQRNQLERLSKHIRPRDINSWFYDGDVDSETRKVLRQNPPAILITNPDMLHKSFLAHADKWEKFLSNLCWVIIDEVHEYRGYFGSNVSMILRRFSYHLAQKGSRPQFFLSSATCANLREHAHNLTGLDFTEITAKRDVRPRRKFWFVQPDIPQHEYWNILQLRAVNAGLACLSQNKSVIVFCPTRKFAENCHRTAKRRIEQLRDEGCIAINTDTVKVFRSGLDVDTRHEIQENIKKGDVRLVFSTNALELGIDIGGLDGIILAGFPDSVMSAWQRIGRAGRRWDSDAFVLYLARNNPMDQFYASNLDIFLKKPLDDLVINPSNEELIKRHVPCLLYETRGGADGRDILGAELRNAVDEAMQGGGGPVHVGNFRPHYRVNIRGGGTGIYKLRTASEEIGAMSGSQKFREAYLGAIYMHGGASYRVESVTQDGTGGVINLGSAEPHVSTRPFFLTTLSVKDIFSGLRWQCIDGNITAYYGEVTVTVVLTSVKEINDITGDVIDEWSPQNESAEFSKAHAFWIQQEGGNASVGNTSLQHILRVGAQFSIPVDSHDMFPHADQGECVVYLVENYPGGIGIARKTLEKWRVMLKTGVDLAKSCSCSSGCPNCIVPPRAQDGIDKTAGIALAGSLLKITNVSPGHKFENGLWRPVQRSEA